MALFTADDRSRIEKAIGEAEAQTAGELVVAVVGRSDRYDFYRAALAAAWTLASAMAVGMLWPALDTRLLLLGQVPAGVLLWLVAGWAPLLRLIVPTAVAEASVRGCAMRLFAERGVHNTVERSGLLIMLSEMERRVVILGDQGIHERVGTDGWEGHVQRIVAGIRCRRAAAAVAEVVASLGEVMAASFPRRPDDTNELPNEVVEELSRAE